MDALALGGPHQGQVLHGVQQVHDEEGLAPGVEAPGVDGAGPGGDEQEDLLEREPVALAVQVPAGEQVEGEEGGAGEEHPERPRAVGGW
jgi:hypothetical protein